MPKAFGLKSTDLITQFACGIVVGIGFNDVKFFIGSGFAVCRRVPVVEELNWLKAKRLEDIIKGASSMAF